MSHIKLVNNYDKIESRNGGTLEAVENSVVHFPDGDEWFRNLNYVPSL